MIRTSQPRDIQQLIADLRNLDGMRREAAVARLRLLGSRAVARLAPIVRDDPHAGTREAALRALEGADDPGVVEVALHATTDADAHVRIAAIIVLRPWVVREDGTRVMDRLVTTALDPAEPSRVRLAALDALSQLPPEIVQPVADRAAIGPAEPGVDDAASVHEWLERHADAPLSSLHDLVAQVRDREARERDPVQRQAWLVARGAVHAALARRESRVALYDLREAFGAAASPLPLDFLQAIAVIGDPSCLEPMARAWAAAPAGETWWRTRLADTARGLLARHHLTSRHAAVKRVRIRWPGFLPAPRT